MAEPVRTIERRAHRRRPARTDVRRRASGRFLATCDCGRSSLQALLDDGWAWVLDHACPYDAPARPRYAVFRG